MHLIAFNGYKGSGKNTAAGLLTDNYTGGEGVVYQIGFADKVKIAAARALGFLSLSPQECIALMDRAKETWVFEIREEEPPFIDHPFHTLTGREFLQHIGTEHRKLFGADFWVDQVLPRLYYDPTMTSDQEDEANQIHMEQRFPGVDCVAITDLRFDNEAERVLALGGQVWRVNRDSCESDGHDSEQRLPDHLVTVELDNNGTIGDLENEVTRAMESL